MVKPVRGESVHSSRKGRALQNWDYVRTFLALHRAGTYEGAARLIALDPSTLRRHIQAIEQQLGTPLFARREGCYHVMPSMRPFLDAALQMEASSRSFFDMPADRYGGAVRVTMLDVVAGWLAPHLAGFRQKHPDIRLDLSTEHHFVDLEKEMVDVAIRLARPMRGGGRLRKLADIDFAVYGAPSYLQRHAASEAQDHDLLTQSVHFIHRDHEFIASDAEWMLHHLPRGQVVSTSDSYLALRTLCQAGLGLTLLPDIVEDGSNGLVRVAQVPAARCELWVLMHDNSGSTPHVRAFVDHLTTIFMNRKLGGVAVT